VHHGNGTQHAFEDRADVLFISLHGHPHWVYPGTGFEHETGTGTGEGYTLNLPMDPGSGDSTYRRAFETRVAPLAEAFAPQFVLVSCGFDAHRRDPLAPLQLETDSYVWMTEWVLDLARRHCDGRLVSLLEGGYDLQALGDSAAAHVAALLSASGRAGPDPRP
jgi:acetoin utilization deacetylase AcuC-like enzyme